MSEGRNKNFFLQSNKNQKRNLLMDHRGQKTNLPYIPSALKTTLVNKDSNDNEKTKGETRNKEDKSKKQNRKSSSMSKIQNPENLKGRIMLRTIKVTEETKKDETEGNKNVLPLIGASRNPGGTGKKPKKKKGKSLSVAKGITPTASLIKHIKEIIRLRELLIKANYDVLISDEATHAGSALVAELIAAIRELDWMIEKSGISDIQGMTATECRNMNWKLLNNAKGIQINVNCLGRRIRQVGEKYKGLEGILNKEAKTSKDTLRATQVELTKKCEGLKKQLEEIWTTYRDHVARYNENKKGLVNNWKGHFGQGQKGMYEFETMGFENLLACGGTELMKSLNEWGMGIELLGRKVEKVNKLFVESGYGTSNYIIREFFQGGDDGRILCTI